MIMKHSFLFFYFVGTFIQLQMNFGIHFIFVIFMMLLTNVKHVKYKKDLCSVTVILTPVPRWTFMDSWKREARSHAWND